MLKDTFLLSASSSSDDGLIDKVIGFFSSAVSSASDILAWIMGAIVAVLVITSIYSSTRYIQRFLYNRLRRLYYKEMVWYEIIPESNAVSEGSKSVSLMENTSNIMPTDMGRGFSKFFWDRPQTALAIKKMPEEASVYLGMDKKHADEDAMIAWVSDAGHTCTRVDNPEEMGLDTRNAAIGVISDFTPSNVTDGPTNSSVGSVISRIQELSGDTYTGTIIMSWEPMRSSERSLLTNHISAQMIKEGGEQAGYSFSARQTQLMADKSISRGSIMAFSDNGSVSDSKRLLETAYKNIANLGVKMGQRSTMEEHRMRSIYAFIAGAIATALTMVVDTPIPTWMVAITMVLAILSLITPIMTSPWASWSAKDGIIPIPPFWRFSWRRIFRQMMVNTLPFDIDTKQLDRPFVALPSIKTVIPLYQTSVMQFSSFPITSGRMGNISSSVIPQVAISDSVESEISDEVESGDAIFLGLSAKNYKPVFRTIKDINFGIGVGGEPGSGKTNELLVDFIGMSALSRKKTGLAADYKINPLWIETKPDDISKIYSAIENYDPRFVTIHDKESEKRLCLEGPRITDPKATVESVQKSVNTLTSAVKAVFGDAMQERGRRIFSSSLLVSMLAKKADIEALGVEDAVGNINRPNVMEFIRVLGGARMDINIHEKLEEHVKTRRSLLSQPNKAEERNSLGEKELKRIQAMTVAMEGLVAFHERRDDPFTSVLNIVNVLSVSSGLWDTMTEDGKPRREFSINALTSYNGPVIADFSPADSEVDTSTVERFTMLCNWMIWSNVKSTRSGAAARKEFIPIYADEITNFVGRFDMNPNECQSIVSEATDQGRSFGISYNFGYQSLGQVPSGMQQTIRGYPSIISMRFRNPDERKKAVERLSESTAYTEDSVSNLPQGIGIAILDIDGKPRKPFTLGSPYSVTWSEALMNSDSLTDAIDEVYDELKDNIMSKGKTKLKKQRGAKPLVDVNERNSYDHYDYIQPIVGEDGNNDFND